MQPFNLSFGSVWAYRPKSRGEEAEKGKNFRYNLKHEVAFSGFPKKMMSEVVADFIATKIDYLPFKEYLGPEVSLVPVPSSSLMKKGTLWVPQRISTELAKKGLGKIYPCLERIKAVPRSSTSKPKDRPMALDHFNSIRIKSQVYRPRKIVLIDDVITRGATFIGCAAHLRKVFPETPIFALAMLRSIYLSKDFKKVRQPCIGTIKLFPSGKTFPEPIKITDFE